MKHVHPVSFVICSLLPLALLLFSTSAKGQQGVTNILNHKLLPDLENVWDIYQSMSARGLSRQRGDTLMQLNVPLKSSNLYVLAAWQYGLANLPDMAAEALHKAIRNGMANPNIISKWKGLEIVSKSTIWPEIEFKLDSIKKRLEKFENFEIDDTALVTFWPYFERALQDTGNAQKELAGYILNGPPVVREFYTKGYNNTYQMYRHMILRTPNHYKYIRTVFKQNRLNKTKDRVSRMIQKFSDLYPQAVFPKVYIVPGIFNTGGTATDLGLIICADNLVREKDMPAKGLQNWQLNRMDSYDKMKYVIIHELMHFQQNYQDHDKLETVVGNVIKEGVCDFLVELVSDYTRHKSMLAYLSIPKNMDFIINEFKEDFYSTKVDNWMKNPDLNDRPVDIGYALGYLICKSYYELSDDKAKAVYKLLNANDFSEIVRNSKFGYVLN